MRLRTARLELVAADASLAKCAAEGARGEFEALLDARLPREWPSPLVQPTLGPVAERLEAEPALTGWFDWYWVRLADRQLVGDGGFKGAPEADGTVEVGYALVDRFQRQGYATEAVRALRDWAASAGASRVVAETMADHAASMAVLRRCGFTPDDETDGAVWWAWSPGQSK